MFNPVLPILLPSVADIVQVIRQTDNMLPGVITGRQTDREHSRINVIFLSNPAENVITLLAQPEILTSPTALQFCMVCYVFSSGHRYGQTVLKEVFV